MSDYSAGQLCYAMAEIAHIMGIQAENTFRQSNGDSIAYGEDAFNQCTANLETYAENILHNM